MNNKAIILGGGITGLTIAWKLSAKGYTVTVIEKESQIGGLAKTIKYKDYLLDLGAHKIFTVMDHVQKIIEELAGDELLKRKKIGSIYYNGVYLPFPVGVKDMIKSMPLPKLSYLIASFLRTKISHSISTKKPDNYEDWFISQYGMAIYNNLVKEATEKIWGTASNLSMDLAARRITSPTLVEIIKNYLLGKSISRVTSADYFYYPKYGCQSFSDKIAARIENNSGRIINNTSVTKSICEKGHISSLLLSNGDDISLTKNDIVISTIPKKSFANTLSIKLPGEVDFALAMLRERNLLLTYLFIDKEQAIKENWIFFPEKHFMFNRLFEQNNCSPYMSPKGRTVICTETTCHADQIYSPHAQQHIARNIIDSLDNIKLIDKNNVIDTYSLFVRHAYPIWDVSYKKHMTTAINYLETTMENFYTVGRQGGFVYGGIADCIDVGLVTSEFILSGKNKAEWIKEREKFDNYVVVD